MATQVQFVNNQFEIRTYNGSWSSWEKFYPLGWYSPSNLKLPCSGNPEICFSDTSETEQAMECVAASGSNTIVEYFNGVIGRYSGEIPDYCINDPETYSAANYVLALCAYLDDAHSNGLKVLVHLPIHQVWDNEVEISNSYLTTVINAVKSHDAVLGWYHADEAEIIDHYPLATYERMRDRYDHIKSLDTDHPVFVVFVSETCFRNRFTTLSNSNCTSVVALELNEYEGPIYDVLMLDFYAVSDYLWTIPTGHIYENDGLPQLRDLRHSNQMLRNIYDEEKTANNQGAVIFVTQGYGRKDLNDDEHWCHGEQTKDYDYPLANPSIQDIHFATLSSAHHIQDASVLGLNLSGLLFWSHRYADQTSRNNVSAYQEYLKGSEVELFKALNSTESTAGISVSFNNPSIAYGWTFFHFIRKYDGKIYIFVIPDKVENSDSIKTVVFDSIEVTGITSHQYCHELAPENGDAWYRIWVSLDTVNSNTVEFMEVESRTFKTYEARVFKITL